MSKEWQVDNVITVAGYECHEDTTKSAKKMLRKLKKNGFLIFQYDDSEGLLVASELVEIAGYIGLKLFEEPYRITLFDERFFDKHTVKSWKI